MGYTVVWGLAPSPHRYDSQLVLSVWSLHVLPVYAWVLSGYSGFLPPSKNMHVRLIGDSKLSLGVSVHGCVSRLSLCGPVMDLWPVQGPHVQRLAWISYWNMAHAQTKMPSNVGCINVCARMNPSTFLLYIPINVELSAHVWVPDSSLSRPYLNM